MFNLITTYYVNPSKLRCAELNNCLLNNFNNDFIKKIYLLNDKIYNLDFISNYESKIVQIVVDENNLKRLGFDYAIKFINENLNGEKCILSNSDIYFDNTLELLVDYDLKNKFIALTRYDNNKIIKHECSQDCWIFQSPLNIDISLCNFKFGIPGCDNRFAYIVKMANYDVINPCLTIKTHHLHSSNIRTYRSKDIVHGPYLYVEQTTLS